LTCRKAGLAAADRLRATERAMPRRIAIIDGHPDPGRERFCHALAEAYAQAAAGAGHDVRRIAIADAAIPFLRSGEDWAEGMPVAAIRDAQDTIAWAEHLVIVYPLWLGSMPALLKAFFEQAFRPGFAIARGKRSLSPGLLKGKSARIVVTMGMPAILYRLFFRAHSLRSLERNILKFSGIGPIRETLIGNVDNAARREKGMAAMSALGREGR
jgi:putative NADPH-quinone reductase